MTQKDVDFQSAEELAALLEEIGLSLHAKNRIAAGESNFLWCLAEVIRSVGRLATKAEREPQLHRLYGNAYDPGDLQDEAMLEHFISLIRQECTPTR